VREREPWLLAVGRIGAHSDATMDLGGTTENLLRAAPCNLLLAARAFEPPVEQVADATMAWTREAEARMQRVPEHARGMARRAVAMHAAAQGHTVITSDVIDACLAAFARPGAAHAAPGNTLQDETAKAGKCPFAHRANAGKRKPRRTEPIADEGRK